MVDEPRSHWGRGWKVFLGIGALLGVLFAFGDLPSKLRDACNGWGIDICRDRYAVETYLSDSPNRAPSARPERMDILGVRVGTVADDVRAMFPPGVKVTAGEASEGKALNAWQWEGVTFAAQLDIATGSLELPFSVAVAEDSKWLVAVPDGILLGKTTLKQAEQVHASRGSAPELYYAWFEGWNYYWLRSDFSVNDANFSEVYQSEDGPRGDDQRPLDAQICSRHLRTYELRIQDSDSEIIPDSTPAGSCAGVE